MEDTEERRERLKRLRERVNADGGATANADEGGNSSLQFKNYRPRNDVIASKQVSFPISHGITYSTQHI